MENWQQQVIASLARLEQRCESIDERLDRLNGSVARHEKAIIVLREGEAVREAASTAAENAREKEAAKYQRWLSPAARLLIGGITVLILEHGQQIVTEGLKVAGAMKP